MGFMPFLTSPRAPRRVLVWLLRLAVVLPLSTTTLSARAQSTSDDLARRHFDSGVAYLEESDYDNALRAFEKAHELSKRPEILMNIATVHERRGDLPRAIGALEQYLDARPDGEHAETVKLRIQNLEKRVAASQQEPVPPPPPPAARATEPVAEPAPPPPPRDVTPPPAPPAEPNLVPAYVALGAGGLLAGGALVTGLLAKGKYDDAKSECSPNCRDADISSSRNLALTSTVLTGVSVVAAGVGVALLLTSSGGNQERAAKSGTDIALSLGPRGAAASAAWRF
jgi:tetratricopeptide (TPR) repeat protein